MENPPYIVGIGASAGGLEALTSFFDHTPLDSVCYAIISHMSADFKSKMVEILSRHSKLIMQEAADGMTLEVNNVYIIPNTKFMLITNGCLSLIDKSEMPVPHYTIDIFFSSLALDRGSRAIGVILSGSGGDGSSGCLDIELNGGAVFIQDPETSLFSGMPNSAIDKCPGAFIHPAENLPMAIEKYIKDEFKKDNDYQVPLSEKFLLDTIELIKSIQPFDFTDYKFPTLIRRIGRRMAHLHLENETEYYQFLTQNPSEVELLIKDFLIGVTAFFRDEAAFNLLSEDVIPHLINHRKPEEELKIWVTSCATGEEAYSIAIIIKEYLSKTGKRTPVKIFATDINQQALNHASRGLYKPQALKTVSSARLETFFDQTDNNFKIKPEIRGMLVFAQHDLTRNPPYCNLDLVSCRNMLIYVKPALQKVILSKFTFGLKKNGFLFLGSSENISGFKEDYIEISAKWNIFQRTDSRRRFGFESYLPPHLYRNKFC